MIATECDTRHVGVSMRGLWNVRIPIYLKIYYSTG